MANQAISALSEATDKGTANLFPVVIDGVNYKLSDANLYKFIGAATGARDGLLTVAEKAKIANLWTGFNKLDATAAPTPNDDSADTSGNGVFAAGSVWVDVTNDEAYRCVDATPTAAVWVKTTLDSTELAAVALSGAFSDLTGQIALGQIPDDLITLAKLATGTANRLIGTDGSGNPVEVTLGANVTLAAGELAASGGAAEIKTDNHTVVVGDVGKTIAMNSGIAKQFTLDGTSFTNGQWVDLMSIGDGATTISGNGLNAAGQDTLVLRKGDRVRVTFYQSADPSWLVEYWDDVALAANQRSTRNSGDTAFEARTDKGQIGATIVWDTTGGPWPIGVAEFPALVRGGNVILIPDSTASGVTVKIYKNGTEINGFATAQAVNYNAGAGVSIATTETFAAGDIITFEIVAATTIAHVLIRIPLTRTGD